MRFKSTPLSYLFWGLTAMAFSTTAYAQTSLPPLPQTFLPAEGPPLTIGAPLAPPPPPPSNSQKTTELIDLVEGQFNAINRKKYDDAYNLFTARPFRDATPYDQFRYFIESYAAFSQNKNAYFGVPTFKSPILAVVPINLISMQGEFLKIEYYIIVEDHQWKVLGIQVFLPPWMKDKGHSPAPAPKSEVLTTPSKPLHPMPDARPAPKKGPEAKPYDFQKQTQQGTR